MKKLLSTLTVCIIILCSCGDAERKPLQIIFTNDTHSQVEPIKGMGGYESRAAIIDSLKKINPNTLLVDAGDMWQGTPYFNIFKGRLEVEAHNMMGYEAATLGNHEFDNGLDTLAARIEEMDFPIVCANYDVQGTPLEGKVVPYTVVKKEGWKIGIIGVCVNPDELILQSNIKGVVYNDPINIVNKYAKTLKKELGCNLVIVLSHLGLHDDTGMGNTTDDKLAQNIKNVDLILGGHTHQYNGAFNFTNMDGDTIVTIQEKKSGLRLYKITVE